MPLGTPAALVAALMVSLAGNTTIFLLLRGSHAKEAKKVPGL